MPPRGDGTSINTIERCGLEVRYLRIKSGPQRDVYIHRLVMEAKLGRPLSESEEVDHIDGDTLNNHPSNLQLLTASEHARETRRRATEKRAAKRRAREIAAADAENGPF
jgi:hypothetical protein